jgi:glyoxylase-like metal-dependent hydrolase (beta-lactamase superfamily II)
LYRASVAPILDAGLAHPWYGCHRIDDNLVLDAAPGHTPGNAVVHLYSDDQRAVFVGDMVHMPLQILNPLYNSGFCADASPPRRRRCAINAWAEPTP